MNWILLKMLSITCCVLFLLILYVWVIIFSSLISQYSLVCQKS